MSGVDSLSVLSADTHSTQLCSSARYRRSPVRGLLRAVSSLTITDTELLEETISHLQHENASSKAKEAPSTTTSTDSSPTFPNHSVSTTRKSTSKAKRDGRRMRSRSHGDESDDDDSDLLSAVFYYGHEPLEKQVPKSTGSEERSAFQDPQQNSGDHMQSKELAGTERQPRQKSIDLFPKSEHGVSQRGDRRRTTNGFAWNPEQDYGTPRPSRRGGGPTTELLRNGEQFAEDAQQMIYEINQEEVQRRPRRKSIDMLPCMPRRTLSAAAVHEATKSQHQPKPAHVSLLDRLTVLSHEGNAKSIMVAPSKQRSSTELSGKPQSSTGAPVFDRFNVDTFRPKYDDDDDDDDDDVDPEDLEEEGLPFKRNEEDIGPSNVDVSPYKVRDFIVSLDDLEGQRRKGTNLRRRPSLDSLPKHPRRFTDPSKPKHPRRFTDPSKGYEPDTDDDGRGRQEVRRRSFDDVKYSSQQFLNLDAVSRGSGSPELQPRNTGGSIQEPAPPARASSRRSRNAERAFSRGRTSSTSHRSGGSPAPDLTSNVDSSSGKNGAATESEDANNTEHAFYRTSGHYAFAQRGNDLDFSTRSQDQVPIPPRRRLPSENSIGLIGYDTDEGSSVEKEDVVIGDHHLDSRRLRNAEKDLIRPSNLDSSSTGRIIGTPVVATTTEAEDDAHIVEPSYRGSNHSMDHAGLNGQYAFVERGNDLDFSTRSQDHVPVPPRRRLPSDNSIGYDTDELSLPLNDTEHTRGGAAAAVADTALQEDGKSEVEQDASVVSKLSSLSMSDCHDDASSLSSRKFRGNRFAFATAMMEGPKFRDFCRRPSGTS